MGRGYTIPGYFENCIVTGDEIRKNTLFGNALFKYSRHELKEAKVFGSTVLVFKNSGIYEPGLFGKRLFKVTPNGEVREDKLFGRVVGAIPPEWVDGLKAEVPTQSNDLQRHDHINADVKEEETLEELKERLDIETGWVADYTNVKVGAETITCPRKYSTVTAIAPALAKDGLKKVKIHAGVTSINTSTVHGYFFIVDADNPNYSSENGVLYNYDKTILYSVPTNMDLGYFIIPKSVKVIGAHAFSFSLAESINIPEGVEEIEDFAFEYNKKLKQVYIPKSVKKLPAKAFIESKKVVLHTPYSEKPSFWEIDLAAFKAVNWNE